MQKFTYGYEIDGINKLNEFLSSKKSQGDYKVLDVGGAVGPWFWNYTDAILDFLPPSTVGKIAPPEGLQSSPPNSFEGEFFEGNITLPEGWDEVNKKVQKNGKFDFVICRHTIEDINHPEFVINELQKVAKAGFIGVPSKHAELTKGIYPNRPKTRGFHHHRWIFVTKNGRLYGLPKMGWTDSLTNRELRKIKHPRPDTHKWELSFYWEENIDALYVVPFTDNIPENYSDDFIIECSKEITEPWDFWNKILIESD